MNTSYSLDTYRAHDLNIAMKTSSGDVIKLDFSNETSASMDYAKDNSSESAAMSFSSMQSFSYSIDSNGITKQDQKEIDAFMKQAKPYIDNFLKELKEDAPKSPVTKLAEKIVSIFRSEDKEQISQNQNKNNFIKSNIVKMFDKSFAELEAPKEIKHHNSLEDIFKEAQKLLEKTLKEFDKVNKSLYA
jgi:cell pole-organizing protein PopZ